MILRVYYLVTFDTKSCNRKEFKEFDSFFIAFLVNNFIGITKLIKQAVKFAFVAESYSKRFKLLNEYSLEY